MEHASCRTVESRQCEGVRYTVHGASLGRRIELTRQVHELSKKIEFLEAGGSPQEQIEAAWLAQEIDATYLRWGLAGIEGLTIDGEAATPESLVSKGPEALCREILETIRAESFLSEPERKN